MKELTFPSIKVFGLRQVMMQPRQALSTILQLKILTTLPLAPRFRSSEQIRDNMHGFPWTVWYLLVTAEASTCRTTDMSDARTSIHAVLNFTEHFLKHP